MLSTKTIRSTTEAALAEWQQLALKVKVEEEACAAKTAKSRARMAELELQIQNTMKRGISDDGQTIRVQSVESTAAIAEVKDEGRREIKPQEFFETVAPRERTEQFWNCLKVVIGKTEKFLPKALMDTLARREPKLAVKVRLKK
jgi:hypothetical protein